MEQHSEQHYEQPAPQPEKRAYTPLQKWLVPATLALGAIVAWWWFGNAAAFSTIRAFIPAYAAFWGVYAISFCAANPARAKRPSSIFLLAAVTLLFVRYAVYAQAETALLNLAAIPLLLMLHAVDSAFDVPGCREGQYLALYLRGWFVAPFACIGRFFGAVGSIFPRGKGNARAAAVRLGLICALPVAIIVTALLVQADAVVAYYLANFFRTLSIWSFLPRVLGALCIAILFFSFLYAMTWQKPAVRQEAYAKKIEPASAFAALGLLLFVYAVFAAFQFTYLTGLAGLPPTLTYSEYAVRGFGELCTVAAINLTVLAVCGTFTQEHKALRPMLLALLGATALLLASALYRLVLYIRAYGLTINRILPLWFMVFLLAVLVFCAIKLFRPNFRLVRVCLGAFVLWYLCLNAVNLDAIIAKSVLANAAQQGTLSQTDASFLRNVLSEDARPVLERSPFGAQIYQNTAPHNSNGSD